MRSDIQDISREALENLWIDNDMYSKRARGLLVEVIVPGGRATNPLYLGGVSRYVKLRTVNDWHIGTLHEIVLPDGPIPHSHPKDYTLRDCTRVRGP